MKKILLPILVACALALPVRGQTILVIDVAGVFNNLTEVKNEFANLNSIKSQYLDYLNTRGNELTHLQSEVTLLQQEAQNPALTPEGRDSLQKQFQDQSANLQTQAQNYQQDQQKAQGILQDRQNKLVQIELQKIHDQVSIIAEKRKASLVLNKSEIGLATSVLYSDKTFDISNEVLDALNKAAEATSAATTPAPATPAATPASTAAPASSAHPAMGTGTSR